ncbi:hypothetical protein VC83_01537 [Pseudogymnoascus destructans]|uniref:Uncharacterized protein n=2 Tax=Pseudogymnoascus destructans TaxID=655981 RepID=L8G021_PSED2|nr:uncharacterized protein VC83_01537 [Pseudogymnoascus destructans]ELR06099.1 hypothetical protein GMDG_01973 [Pseudogymnoascus destructans 20631-21]OAF61766.1 hypothetical protein VC83_01537 [Pseudogymnoascus destructans]
MRPSLHLARYARPSPPHTRAVHIPPSVRSILKPIIKPIIKPVPPEEETRDTTGETHEYTLSSDDQRTAKDKESFDPKVTRPELEREEAAREHEADHSNNPLEYSPANREVSKQCPQTEDRAEGAPKDRRPSSQGHPKKGKVVPKAPDAGKGSWTRWLG